jgi:hypothetical protein
MPRKESVFGTWVLIILFTVWFLAYSLFTYFFVGDRGQPTWNLGTLNDVPATSPYAIYKKIPYPQHVRGEKGD